MRLDCTFTVTPRIVLSDKNLSSTEKLLIGLIISLTLNKGYCFASNKYLANFLNISTRTISDCLSKLKVQNYIFVNYDNGKRRIYLNTEKIPTKASKTVAENCSIPIEENCDHNIKKNYKRKWNISSVPYWLEHPEVCKSNLATEEEMKEMEELLKEFKD